MLDELLHVGPLALLCTLPVALLGALLLLHHMRRRSITAAAGIRAMTEALADSVVTDPDEVAQYAQRIGQQTQRLTGRSTTCSSCPGSVRGRCG